MSLYELTPTAFTAVKRVSFAEQSIKERGDLQRLLRTHIHVIGDDLYVLTEEFGEWDDSKRRIDLLAIDLDANLVVIELKRTNDGGHMELQAIRYASMISTMTFDQAVDVHSRYLKSRDHAHETTESSSVTSAREHILAFLNWDTPDNQVFGSTVRIILISEDFGKELTTSVLWLRERGIDIRCIRLRPYQHNGSTFIDVQPLIPLPEMQEYQIKVAQKGMQQTELRNARSEELLRFWSGVLAIAKERKTRHAEIKPGTYQWIGASSGFRGINYIYSTTQNDSVVELYIDRGDQSTNKRIFDALFLHHAEIAGTFAGHGPEIEWQRLDSRRASRIRVAIADGGYLTEPHQQPEQHRTLVTTMIHFEQAIHRFLADAVKSADGAIG
jgi:hypothetical protein